jgi:ABC-2 type transport system ATP-binding protein
MRPWIEVSSLQLDYETRKLEEGRSWLRSLWRADYQRVAVLRDLDFRVEGPGITAILGKNGTGKTTLMKVLSGILTPSFGQVRVLGFEPSLRHPDYLRQIGAVFGAKKALWPELSLTENLDLTRAIYRIPTERFKEDVHHLIQLFQLEGVKDRPAKSFSLGQSMKGELVNVLVCAPQVVFLDEPTIGLDLQSQLAMRKAIRDYVAESGCHVLLTSHNLSDVTELADQVYFLEQGRLQAHRDESGQLLRSLEARLLQ